MGDLRNKIRKQMEREQHEAWLREHYPPPPAPEPPQCQCGRTHHETMIWAGEPKDRWAPIPFYCEGCLPAEYRWLLDRPAP